VPLGSAAPTDFPFAFDCLLRLLPSRSSEFDNGVRLRCEEVHAYGAHGVRRVPQSCLSREPTDFFKLSDDVRDRVGRRHPAVSADGTVTDADLGRALAGFPICVTEQHGYDAPRRRGKLSPQPRPDQDSDIALKACPHRRTGRLLEVLPFRYARYGEPLRNPQSRV